MLCSRCGHLNRDAANFCDQCGQALHPGGRDEQAPNPRAYTPRHLAERILTARAALEGERKQVTVLFADIKDSMPLAERLGAEAWHALLDRFFHVLNEGVHRFEGTVNQYTGDGVMALFGAPLALEDHAQRACHAALHLREQLTGFAAQLRQSRGITLAVRMGLNSGEVVVGRIGDDLRMDYTAQGHTVGLAQRVEQLADPDTACVAESTAALVADSFALRDRGTFELKGVSEPVRVYELAGIGQARTRVDLLRRRNAARFVGRRAERVLLARALDEAVSGHGRVVSVVGEPGVGKTRLCLELLRECRPRGVTLAQAHCPAHAAGVPLLPILDLLRSLLGVAPDDAPDVSRGQVRLTLQRLGRGVAEAYPLACELLDIPDPDRPVALLEEQRRARLVDFVRRLVQAQSAAGPLLLFVDDAHCIDPDADALLGEIAEALGWTRTLMLVTLRPGQTPAWSHLPYHQTLALAALGEHDSDALLRRLVGDDPSTADLRRLVRERTGGNPFFAEEVVLSLLDRGALLRSDPEPAAPAAARRRARPAPLRLGSPVDDLVIPPTLQALVAARLDRLPELAKRVLQAAAVIGPIFTPPVLRQVLADGGDLGAEAVDGALAALQGADFIRRERDDADAACAFKHPLTQAVAYGSQLAETRARLHVAVAQAIQALYAEQLGQHAGLLAHHFAAANWRYEAARWRRRAALRVTNIELRRARPEPQRR